MAEAKEPSIPAWDDQSWELFDAAVRQLEEAWQSTSQPEPVLARFVPVASTDPRYGGMLAKLVDVDRECRNAAGCPKSPEEYLAEFPILREESNLLDVPTHPFVGTASLGEKLGSMVGPYKLLSVLGEGGFGSVYLADQEKPIRRRVALKIIKAGMDTRQVLARFEAERQALAMMDHPNIAKVFDAGITGTGRSYFAMELIHGEPITTYCDRHKLTLEERLDLFISVCQAVQHAHQKGIIHRDLKPSNVLVTVTDDRQVPKIIDFGVSKATAQPLTQQTIFTEQGQLIGTPEYMSPEQAEMTNLDIDTRSDVYSLGVLLYELLTGVLPFEHKMLRQVGLDEIRRIIREVEPSKPSTKISSMGEQSELSAKNRCVDTKTLRRRLRSELDWIVTKAMEKDRKRRYSTASSFAEDVQHYLQHEPVQAGPPGGWYRLRKYARRYRTPLVITAGFVGLLVAIMIVAIWGYYQKSQLSADAELARQKAVGEAANAKAAELRTDEALEKVQQAKKATEQVLVDMYASTGLRADERNDPYEAILWFANAAAQSKADPDRLRANSLRFDSWSRRLWVPVRIARFNPENPIGSVAFHPGGKCLLIHAEPNKEILWDVLQDKFLDLPGGERPILAGQWSPSGDRLALATPEGQVTLYSFPDGKRLRQFQQPGNFCSMNFSEDGRYLGLASETVYVWDCQSEQAPPQVFSHPQKVFNLTFSSQCHRLVTTCVDGRIRVFALGKPGKSQLLFQPIPNPTSIPPLLVNGGKELITVSGDREVAWWNSETGERLRTESYSGSPIAGLKRHPDGDTFAVYGFTTIDIWSFASSEWTKYTLEGHRNEIAAVDWFSDHSSHGSHSLLVSISNDRTARLWCWRCNEYIATIPHQDEVSQVACSKNGCWIATVQKNQLLRIWTLPDPPKTIHIPVETADHRVVVSRDGRYLMLAGWWRVRESSAALIHRVEGGDEFGEPLETGGYLNGGAISPQGDLVVTLGSNETKVATVGYQLDWEHLPGQILFWKFPSGKRCFSSLKTAAEPVDADFSPDGKWLAVVCAEGTVLLIDPRTGHVERKYQGRNVTTAAWGYKPNRWILFSPRGDCFLTANFGSEVCIRFLDNEKQEMRIKLEGIVRHAEFSSDGKLVVVAFENKVRVFDVLTGKPQGPVLLHPDWVFDTHFKSDGQVLLTACRDHMARLWNWRDGVEPLSAMEQIDEIFGSGFSANNNWVITIGRDASLNVWDCAGGMRVMPSTKLSGQGLQFLFTPDKKHVIVPYSSPLVDIFDFSELVCEENGGSDGNWKLPWAEIISGRQMKKNHTVNLSMEEWYGRWQQFNKSYPQVLNRIIEQKKEGDVWRPSSTQKGGEEATTSTPALNQPSLNRIKKRLQKQLPGAKKLVDAYEKWSWSPDGKQIVYVTDDQLNLRILNLQTNQSRAVMKDAHDPAWSPGEGRWIAFERKPNSVDAKQIWLVSSAGGEPKKLCEGSFPLWSADGKILYFYSQEQQKILAIKPDEASSKPSEYATVNWYFPAISSDGKRIAFPMNDRLAIMDRETGKTELILPIKSLQGFLGSWSPNGKEVAYGSFGFSNTVGLWIYNLETKQQVKLADGPWTMPVWSPDGSKFTFQLRTEEERSIWMVDAKVINSLKTEMPGTPSDKVPDAMKDPGGSLPPNTPEVPKNIPSPSPNKSSDDDPALERGIRNGFPRNDQSHTSSTTADG